jgi:hypothetical protein
MLTDFYPAFSALCFTLLGLWLVVVQTRLNEWQASPTMRRRAYGVALHFSLPGMMGLLSLIDPASKPLWRTSFVVVAVSGAVAHRRRPAGAAGQSFPRLRELRMIWVTRYLLRPSFCAISSGLSPCSL